MLSLLLYIEVKILYINVFYKKNFELKKIPNMSWGMLVGPKCEYDIRLKLFYTVSFSVF